MQTKVKSPLIRTNGLHCLLSLRTRTMLDSSMLRLEVEWPWTSWDPWS